MESTLEEKLIFLSALIGHTPIEKFNIGENSLFIKREDVNPTGSIKDRSVLSMVKNLPNINNCKGIVIASSGNAGISLAYISNQIGIKCYVFGSDRIEQSKKRIIEKLNATFYECRNPDSYAKGGWIHDAKEFAETHNLIYLDQFNNPSNVKVHEEVTAEEVCSFFEQNNTQVDYIFLGIGSGGTAQGLKNYFDKKKQETKIIIVDPKGGIYYGEYHNEPSIYQNHLLESISDSFIPENISTLNVFDDVVTLDDGLVSIGQNKLLSTINFLGGETCGFIFMAILEYISNNDLQGKNFLIFNTDSWMRNI